MTVIGRERESGLLLARLETSRLVTVIGPGGVGKTALARHVAAAAASRFEVGVRTVDLTRVESAGAVGGAMAGQLGFVSFEALLDSPTEQSALVVVDNCEHLLDAAAAAIGELLEACQAPTVLATSRSPLEMPGESVVVLGPLAVPADDLDVASAPAVQLFLERARDAGADLTDVSQVAVAELCRRLDGLPLALEIAAARARTMSVAEIAARVGDDIGLLHRPRYRGARRHRSVVEMIRWSYDLLDAGEAELLDRLAVFAGPFPADVARQVVAFDDDERDRFDERFDTLLHASLITADTSTVHTRYRLLDTVRRFALDQLARRDELHATYDRFADHVVQWARTTLAGSTTSWRPELVADLLASYDNIADALRWCNRHDTDGTRALLLCSVLWGVIHQRHTDDIACLARETLERWPADGSALAANATATLATAEYLTGQPERAIALATDALDSLASPTTASVTLRRVIGQSARALGDVAGSIAVFTEGAAVARRLGMMAMAIELDVAGGLVEADVGRAEEALHSIVEAGAEAASIGSVISEVWARSAEGYVRLRIDVDDAVPVIEDALSRARAIGYPIGVAVSLRSLAFAHIARDDWKAAASALAELCGEIASSGALADLGLLLDASAVLCHRTGNPIWEPLAATARSVPVVSLAASVGYPLFALPETQVAALSRRDAMLATRAALSQLAVTFAHAPSPDGFGAPAGPAAAPIGTASLTERGDVWEFQYAGRTVTVKASKGVADLAKLLAAGGREIHCLDLIGGAVQASSTGDVIDAEARRRYEQRIRDLQADIDEAQADNDFGRADRAQVELDTLIDHLAAALGQGGRTRRATGTAEKARSAVTQRLRSTIRRLERLDPELGRHFRASITTGNYCSYRPERTITWHVG